jgi:hypothetical protein
LLPIVSGRTRRNRGLSQIAAASRRAAQTAKKGMTTTAILPKAKWVEVPGQRM